MQDNSFRKVNQHIKNDFINDDDIEYMYDLIHSNEHLLLKIDNYATLNSRKAKLYEKIENLPQEIQNLVFEYISVSDDILWYSTALTYFLGISKGLNINNPLK